MREYGYMTREPFEDGEWYHCYTRGVDKRKTFLSNKDYERFTELLYPEPDGEMQSAPSGGAAFKTRH